MPKSLETIEDVEEFCETYWDIITSDKVGGRQSNAEKSIRAVTTGSRDIRKQVSY